LCYKENKRDKELKKLLLRRITNQDEKGRKYVFISNNIAITKKMKQNFQLHCFCGESEKRNTHTNLGYTHCPAATQRQRKHFSTIASLERQHLMSNLNPEKLLKNPKKVL